MTGKWEIGSHLPRPQKGINSNYVKARAKAVVGLYQAVAGLEPGQHITLYGHPIEAWTKLKNNATLIKRRKNPAMTFTCHQIENGAILWRLT